MRQILKGEIYLSPGMSRRMISQLAGRGRDGASPLETLSDRELEVYELVGGGLTTRNIAERLHLSVKTIESHKAHLKETGIADRKRTCSTCNSGQVLSRAVPGTCHQAPFPTCTGAYAAAESVD